MANEIKKYYTRKIYGTGAYYLGLFYAVILVILLLTKHYQEAVKNSFPTFFALYFGQANRKPRIMLTADAVIANNLWANQIFPLANVERVEADKKFRIILKIGKPFPLAKWEFSKATREQVARDVAVALKF